MVSNFNRGGGKGPCLRTKKRPPEVIQEILGKDSARAAARVSNEDYCAAHLAMLCQTALEHIEAVRCVRSYHLSIHPPINPTINSLHTHTHTHNSPTPRAWPWPTRRW